ncbi:hypothetical protein HN51_062935 [Arachis hypogaea]|uniref:transcription factor bHLH79 isoform X1 n=1 Tax=Arachis ipaensis TaxID=130454 RepID=UPI0007AF3A9F|nr:transcription factor bHLH79 isoform X1 [Arachis ipaensis]XP_020978906.1 transcription factor bHLH79 isoform X1 [Arachis ipaensis]XP_020978910.1 transcription factor bHLH79 isoform X1 [Arachis ipaensis]XP_025629222.1 transcription factor bHLH79 isoform X1 [Arachis hypogaea]QHO20464.1 Transcription factor [Arachis hypogaea]
MEGPVINESTFSSANPSSYSLSEIWPATATTFTPIHNHKRKESSPSSSTTTATANHLNDSYGNKHRKLEGSFQEENRAGDSKAVVGASLVAGNKLAREGGGGGGGGGAAKPSCEQPPKQDYIHVRARRGQATDSHSLAERARREKISERMKILQDLVPGCNKVIGKALVLDEIINYIQSLQRQVEFLSMKLEAVNSRLNMNSVVECFPSKDVQVGNQPFDIAGMIFGSQATRGYAQGSQSGWLHMQLGGDFDRVA